MIEKTLVQAVGDYMAKCRKTHGITLDDIATAANKYGTQWSATQVRRLETGQRESIRLSALITVMRAINDLCGEDATISSFLRDIDPDTCIRLNSVQTVRAGELYAILNGGIVNYPAHEPLSLSHMPDGTTLQRITATIANPPSLSETRAAANIGISVQEIRGIAQKLYGHGIKEEASLRAGEGASAQKRGYAMRSVLKEIKGEASDGCGLPAD